MTVYLIYTKPYGPALSELASLAIMDDEFIAEHPGDDEIWWTDPMGSRALRSEGYDDGLLCDLFAAGGLLGHQPARSTARRSRSDTILTPPPCWWITRTASLMPRLA